MTDVFSKPKWLCYFLLVGLILASNSALYYSPVYESVPAGAVWGSLFDLLLMIPLLTYLFILRKRHSLKYLGLVILGCYLAAYLIIPPQHLKNITMIPYFILAFEVVFISIELFVFYKIIVRLPKIITSFQSESIIPYFYQRAINAFSQHLPVNRMAKVFLSDMSVFYYALFCWKKKPPFARGKYFTYHKNSSVMMIYIMLIHATVIETIGLHVLVHQWSVILSWGLLAINFYGILFFIGEIHAIRLSPFIVHRNNLYLQIGMTKSAVIPFEALDELRAYKGPVKLSKLEQRTTMDATVKDIFNDKPAYEIVLCEKVEVQYMYGFKKNVDRIFITVDDYEGFKVALKQ